MALKKKPDETPSLAATNETVAAPSETTAAPAEEKKAVRRFVGTKYDYWHPFQKKTIPLGGDGVVLEYDSWLECQIKAGLIAEV